jgi:hypothetical protein
MNTIEVEGVGTTAHRRGTDMTGLDLCVLARDLSGLLGQTRSRKATTPQELALAWPLMTFDPVQLDAST